MRRAAKYDKSGEEPLQPDLGPAQIGPRLGPRRRALLAGPDARRAARTRASSPAAITRMAVEDIGLADPAAPTPSASPPGRPTSASARPRANWRWPRRSIYLALAPKSNAAYGAFGARPGAARADRLADAAQAHPERADPADEGHRLRQGIRLRPRRRGRASPARTTFRRGWSANASTIPEAAVSNANSAKDFCHSLPSALGKSSRGPSAQPPRAVPKGRDRERIQSSQPIRSMSVACCSWSMSVRRRPALTPADLEAIAAVSRAAQRISGADRAAAAPGRIVLWRARGPAAAGVPAHGEDHHRPAPRSRSESCVRRRSRTGALRTGVSVPCRAPCPVPAVRCARKTSSGVCRAGFQSVWP